MGRSGRETLSARPLTLWQVISHQRETERLVNLTSAINTRYGRIARGCETPMIAAEEQRQGGITVLERSALVFSLVSREVHLKTAESSFRQQCAGALYFGIATLLPCIVSEI